MTAAAQIPSQLRRAQARSQVGDPSKFHGCRIDAVSANRLRATLAAMFAWAMVEGLAERNPVITTRKREEKSRDRVLTDAELKVIWDALADNAYGSIIKILMLTGMRANEVARLRWSEIDFDRGVISLSAERVKNGHAHQVPMSGAVRAILEARPRTGDLVFGRFGSWSQARKALDAAIGHRIATHWVPHDLRRSCASGMARLGVAIPTIEKILNHRSGTFRGIVGVYQHYDFAAEMKAALDRWSDHVAAVVAGVRHRSR
jgi:integrase